MNTPVVVASGVAVIGAAWYYHRSTAAKKAALANPNETANSDLAQQAQGYARNTGQTGDTYTSNYRYGEYLQYLKQGGTNSGSSFDQFLTAAQGNSLPSN